jgi:hypothetical protein
LPEEVRHELIRQCRGGRHPALPPAFAAVLARLPGVRGDEDFGDIPRPAPGLAEALVRAETCPSCQPS